MAAETKNNPLPSEEDFPQSEENLQGLDDGDYVSAEAPSPTIILVAEANMDDEKPDIPENNFSVDRKDAMMSNLVSTALEKDPNAKKIPLPSVKRGTLKWIVDWMKLNKDADKEKLIPPAPLRSKDMADVVDSANAEFIDNVGKDRQQLYDLILAANYMDIKPLLHLGCAKVASLIKGQPLEKIKDILDPNGSTKRSADEKKE